jgi:hypothetical protein
VVIGLVRPPDVIEIFELILDWDRTLLNIATSLGVPPMSVPSADEPLLPLM